MFGSQTVFSVLFVVLSACALSALAAKYGFSGNFIETRESLPDAFTNGTFYYLYDTESMSECRLRLIYHLPGNVQIDFLYEYMYDPRGMRSIVYSMCGGGSCKAQTVVDQPDKWWYDSEAYELDPLGVEQNGFKWYNRKDSVGQVSKIFMNGATSALETNVRQVNFKDGRNFLFTSFTPVEITANNAAAFNQHFQKLASCPEATCSIFADIVFVVDNSESLNNQEWLDTMSFVEGVMDSFDFYEDENKGAAAAVIQFSGSVDSTDYSSGGNSIQCTKNGQNLGNKRRPHYDYKLANFGEPGPHDNTASGLAGKSFTTSGIRKTCKDVCIDCSDGQQHEPSNGKCSGRTGGGHSATSWSCTRIQQCTPTNQVVSYKTVTVTNNITSLKEKVNGNRPSLGYGTCQGFGLDLAMDAFDGSARNGTDGLIRIVIAVTDGADHCPNRTAESARRLREEYGALFIGVGVGLECDYDENFIRNITSGLNSENDENKLYLSVNNYAMIKDYVIDIFGTLCDQYSSPCPDECDAFCACGGCYCPFCNATGDGCVDPFCAVVDGTSNGCVRQTVTCPDPENDCYWSECNPSDGHCITRSPCTETKSKYPKYCQKEGTQCTNGECPIVLDHDYCRDKHLVGCEHWKCTDISLDDIANGESYPEIMDEDGCYLWKNATLDCENMRTECHDVTCVRGEGDEEPVCQRHDTCEDNECFTLTCEDDNSNGIYYCHAVPKDRPDQYKDTKCRKYKCINETGWSEDVEERWDGARCEANATNTTCRSFDCDDEDGCVETPDDVCSAECEAIKPECRANALAFSTVDPIGNCSGFRFCVESADGVECSYSFKNCSTSEAADTAEQKNAQGNDEYCYTLVCSSGECKAELLTPVPKSTKCIKYKCEGDRVHGWQWVAHETDDFIRCNVPDDACYVRHCDDELGCVEDDICESNTDECRKFTCVNESNVFSCVSESLLKTYECIVETCVDGRIIRSNPDVSMCQDFHNCSDISCPGDIHSSKFGLCVYTSKLPEQDRDPCYNYTCDPETDEFVPSYRCDDGLFCTEDKCSINGNCRNVPISCYDELDMSGYPCFKAVCKEDYANNDHRCVRKLRSGAYIDICGQCIHSDEDLDEEESDLQSVAENACTDAPDEPILKEGLAAASIALIVLGAIIIGAALATSGVLGTKSLLERARAANNQTVVSNPLFEDSATEMTNPAFVGDN